ncbi:energy transducer TonB [Luteibacter aegosomatissinici]|uniref:energy transducer TonB n=1 Tax=Luteibacter aegosomatissinici TaxID=2911539 RepID=UPI001FF737CF|nr:energy transducer TonB [Luteibacter aegosomatissinici]UPG95263.1 TonB family protein [Luteibacter aegosomatissinici]
MSFARPQALSGIHPDAVRIAAMSAAIALNAAALIAVMRPMMAEIVTFKPIAQTITLIDHPTPPKPVPVPDIKLQPLIKATPVTVPKPHEAPQPPVVISTPTDEGSIQAPPVTQAPATPAPAVEAAPVETTLAYVAAPAPKYPTQAIRGRMQGTVTLRVLVDESGKPLDVVVESSSGHQVLDDAARKQVLSSWRFQPAVQNGQHVKAWARIPVTFDLRSL